MRTITIEDARGAELERFVAETMRILRWLIPIALVVTSLLCEFSAIPRHRANRQLLALGQGKKGKLVTREVSLGKAHLGMVPYSFVVSPDGKRAAYIEERGDKQFVVVDGKRGTECEGIMQGTPVFSPDSKHVAYGAQSRDKGRIVVDEKEGREYDGIGEGPTFSPDGKHITYAARRGSKWLVVVDGREGKLHDENMKDTPVFSPDSKHVAWGTRLQSGQ